MADLYGDGLYGADTYSGTLQTEGYGSGLYGADVYGGAQQGAPGGALFGPPAKRKKPRQPQVHSSVSDDDEAAIALVLTLL